ncbi:MAG: hypothetical protein V1800_18420 [Candidatus Latescibacterota bacterium]
MIRTLDFPVLGYPLLTASEPGPVDPRRALNIVSIEQQLRTFLGDQIDEFRPNRIVVIERKGTAILRALEARDKNPLKWPWKDVASSVVVEELPDEWLADQRILVFDDMMRSGDHLIEVFDSSGFDRLWKLAKDVRVAIFAVHEKKIRGRLFGDQRIPHTWFYNDLPTPAYRNIRFQIVEMLQRAGSLMLDTEHIEVRLELRGSLERFVEVLRRRADAAVFHSANRVNITVYYGDDEAHQLPTELFPDGTKLNGIVKKCRIVQRDGDMFAIIPMCYPSVPDPGADWPAQPEYVKLIGPSVHTSGQAQFYGAALFGALWILKWVLRDLAAAEPDLYRIHLPGSSRTKLDDSLEHLRVMYPAIDLDQSARLIADKQREAQGDGVRLRRRDISYQKPSHWPDDELRADATRFLQVIRHVLDERLIERHEAGEQTPVHSPGLRATEIFRLGERLGWEPIRISCLFDILIDEADLVTHVEKIVDNNGQAHWVRTFEPDGEIVSDLARRLTRQWGLPIGF